MDSSVKLQLAGIVDESVVDGPGLRLVVFAQGCPHQCKGCHNPDTHPFEGGETWEIADILRRVEANPLLAGVTLTGGEPFTQARGFARLASEIKARGLNVVIYTGYTFEQISQEIAKPDWQELLRQTDILVDGPFIEAQRDLNLSFRGSTNQRIIDLPRTLKSTKIIEIEL